MSLKEWASNGWIRPHRTSRDEIENLFRLADRDIADSEQGRISNDRKFNIAYSAILHLCLIPLYCHGYRVGRGEGHHFRTIQSLKFTMGVKFADKLDYFDDCRTKRYISNYDRAGTISEDEAQEILSEAKEFRAEVTRGVQEEFPQYYPA